MTRISVFQLLTLVLPLVPWGAPARAQCGNGAVNSRQAVTVTTSPLRLRFHEHFSGWNAAGVRSRPGADWNLSTYLGTAPYPDCVAGFLAGSSQPTGVDLVLGDFDYKPFTDYYMNVVRASGGADATLEWEVGGVDIAVGQAPITIESDSSDVVNIFNLALTAGFRVAFLVGRTGAADLRLLLFEPANTTGGVTWLPGSARAVDAITSFDYTPQTSGVYGMLIVNENGAEGTCSIRVVEAATAGAGDSGPTRTRLLPPRPNPARRGVAIDFELASPARVAFEVLDDAGRVAARIGERAWDAGRGSQPWPASGGDGARVPAGLYWVRMQVDGRWIGARRVALLQ